MPATLPRPKKPNTWSMIRPPIAPCEILPLGMPGALVVNEQTYTLEYNAELPDVGEPIVFGYRLTSPQGEVYDLDATTLTCDCKGHTRWGHCKHSEALASLTESREV